MQDQTTDCPVVPLMAINTNYDKGTPIEARLRQCARAGFNGIHWCEDMWEGKSYDDAAVARIAALMQANGLSFLSMHSPFPADADMQSGDPMARARGIALVQNRLAATAALGGHCLVIHSVDKQPQVMPNLIQSLDRLADTCRKTGVVLAIEAFCEAGAAPLFERYPRAVAGFCYDTGHCNIQMPPTLSLLESFGERLCELHLHDNYGKEDDHRLPFDGTVDWPYVTGVLARRGYSRPLTLEIGRLTYSTGRYAPNEARLTVDQFLAEALRRAVRLAEARSRAESKTND